MEKDKINNRREEAIVNRLRTGHWLLKHGFLMDNSVPNVLPSCEECQKAVLTLNHVLLYCPAYEINRQRVKMFKIFNNRTLKIVEENINIQMIIEILKLNLLYDRI